jgi:hypothetical protein
MEEELRRLNEELIRQRQVHQETMKEQTDSAVVNIKDECLEDSHQLRIF